MAQATQTKPFFLNLIGSGARGKPKESKVALGTPVARNRLIVQRMSGGSEAMYFWILNFIRHPNALGYDVVEKISDVFSASESSSFFGNIEQRKSVQQDRISQYLATIGNMTKSVFQIIRELRVIDERLDYYEKSLRADSDVE